MNIQGVSFYCEDGRNIRFVKQEDTLLIEVLQGTKIIGFKIDKDTYEEILKFLTNNPTAETLESIG